MGRIVGIDYGTARIGIAIASESKLTALPVKTMQAPRSLEESVQLLAKELAPYGALDSIVIGLPLLLNGKEGEMALLVKTFGTRLAEVCQTPVIYWDERLTSAQVDKFMASAGVKRKKRTEHIDSLAAATILQTYLDSR